MNWKQAQQVIKEFEKKVEILNKELNILELRVENVGGQLKFTGVTFNKELNGVESTALFSFFNEVEKIKNFLTENEMLDEIKPKEIKVIPKEIHKSKNKNARTKSR